MIPLWKRARPLLSTFVRFMRISYLELKSDYQGTRIGLLWVPLSTLIFTLLLALVFRNSGSRDSAQFFLYVLAGYTAWNFIADSISGSTNIIQTKLDFAVHSNLSLAGLFGKLLADRTLEYSMNLAILVVATMILHPAAFAPQLLLFVPFFALLAATSLGVSYGINLVTVVFPDLTNLIKTGVRFMFFATPVFWASGEKTGIRAALEAYNPAGYYLRISRQVFSIEPLEWFSWGIALALTLIAAIGGIIAYQRSNGFVRNIK